jgi:hypothetical protein
VPRSGCDDEEEFRNDPLVCIAATILDPRYGESVPPTTVTAGQLIQLASRQRRDMLRRRMRWLGAPVFVAVLVAAVIMTGAGFFSGSRHPGPISAPLAHASGGAPLMPPEPLRLSEPGTPARAQLVALAARSRACADLVTPARYTYVHTIAWSAHDGTSARDEQLWWAANHSGRQIVAEVDSVRASGAPLYGSVGDFRPGELSVVIDSPSTDPAVLSSQLAQYQSFKLGPQVPLRSVVDLYRYHALDAAHRSAAIRVLTDTSGLLYGGRVRDPVGRAGLAISAADHGGTTRDVAVFEPATGRLLSYERDALSPTAGAPVAVLEYVVFLDAGTTEEVGEPMAVPAGG